MKIVTTDAKKALEENFMEELKNFISDESYFDEYREFTPLGDKVLIKLFRFTPKDNLKKELGQTEILMPGALDGKWKPKTQALAEKIFPIVKVIKKGLKAKDDFVKIGGTYTVPYEEITGTQWNPDFLHLMNTFAKMGDQGKLVNVPKDMPQRLPKMAIEWARYKFSMPDRLDNETDNDKLIFLIPTLKLESIYEMA